MIFPGPRCGAQGRRRSIAAEFVSVQTEAAPGSLPTAACPRLRQPIFCWTQPAPQDRTLWVAAMGRGVYKSTDDGATWTLKNQGITQNLPLAWRLARAKDGTLYLAIARRSEDGSIGTSGDG